MSSKFWILYDGRAEVTDTDDCSILEAIDDLNESLDHWCGHDGVLFEYDEDGMGNLTNEKKIGHLREGTKALLAKCMVPA